MRLKDVTDIFPKYIGYQRLSLFHGIIPTVNVMYYTHTYYNYGSDKIGKLHIIFGIIFGIYSVLSLVNQHTKTPHVNQHTKTPRKYQHNPTIR